MPRRRPYLLVAFLTFTLALVSTLASTTPAAAAPIRLMEPADLGEIPGPVGLREAVEFRIVGKDLVVATALQPTGGTKRVVVDGLPGSTRVSVQVRARPDIAFVGLYFRLMHSSPELESAPKAQSTVYTRPGYLEVSRVVTTAEETESITLTQRSAAAAGMPGAEERVSLRVRRVEATTNETVHDMQYDAESVVDLMRHAPREAAEHLGPLFRAFGQERDVLSADLQLAWQVLADVLPADPAMTGRVRAVVAALDDRDFRNREAAFAELRRLGGPAALVFMSRGSGGFKLSAEQRTKVEAFLADYRPLSAREAAERRGDADFLLTCVAYCDDAAIRRAAAEALRPRDPAGRAMTVASIDDDDARATAAAEVRRVLSPGELSTRTPFGAEASTRDD